MNSFDDRKKGHEAKFAYDADTEFRVVARRNKLVGLWAAEKQALSGEAAAAYARSVVQADFEEAGDEDVIRKLVADLAAFGTTEDKVRAALVDCLSEARAQIAAS